jgi:NADH-quinone oxidoreductase subunit N
VLGIGLGGMLVAAAANMLTMWLGLELISLSSYALAAWRARDRRAAEAGMKYVLFGGAASGLMLFGISHLYGLTGHLDFAGIGAAFAVRMPLAVVAALLMAAVGVAYKLTVVPFHFYAPDVYQGAPALSVAAVGAVPKLASAAVLLRGLASVLPPTLVGAEQVGLVLAVAAIASLAVASLTALAQRDAKRIVAFSGIGHGGTVLLAIASQPSSAASASAVFYLFAYAAANLGALLSLSVLERDFGSCELNKLAGAMRRRPWVTAGLCMFLFSLAGVPPLAGFTAKWAVLQQALGGGGVMVAAALVLLASTAVFAWAYLLIVRAAVLAPAPEQARASGLRLSWQTGLVLFACAAATIGLGLWLDGLPTLARSLS